MHTCMIMVRLVGILARCDSLQEIKKESKKIAKEAGEFAISSPQPPISDLFTNIMVDQGDEVIQGSDPFTSSANLPS